ncbi:MAG: hypothetical protein HXX13_05570 [Bacteroidetes bacterium]|nr:hypothetical protein [Bacteroidota bacterium]
MRKLFLLSIILSLVMISYSQDIITTIKGDVLKTKVVRVTDTHIEFKNYNAGNDSILTLARPDVRRIDYQNGIMVIYAEDIALNQVSDTSLFAKGKQDARLYYRDYKAAATGTLIATLANPLYGLIPAIACSTTKPKPVNLNLPANEFRQNPDYLMGYLSMAKKIKSKKVWKNYGIGSGIYVGTIVTVALLISALTTNLDKGF